MLRGGGSFLSLRGQKELLSAKRLEGQRGIFEALIWKEVC